jgi:hypothetical protein
MLSFVSIASFTSADFTAPKRLQRLTLVLRQLALPSLLLLLLEALQRLPPLLHRRLLVCL